MSEPIIRFEGVGKRFGRNLGSSLRHGLGDAVRGLLRLPARTTLGKDEFWALREISFSAGPGECIGIIGPNGAGKSTLLKLANRDYSPDRGRVVSRGRIKSLIRLGTGLQPLLTGRENIYIKHAELGFGKRETDAKVNAIAAFAGLETSLDKPIRHYSDGMYARLEFAIATAAPMDILLIDEVLSVGDVAFQVRALERLEQLRQAGTTILFVSHSEMHVRRIADRCLLLFDGVALACGATDPLFRRYYESVGFNDRILKPLGAAAEAPEDFAGVAAIQTLDIADAGPATSGSIRTGTPLTLSLKYSSRASESDAALVLQFWNPAGLLLGSLDSKLGGSPILLAANGGMLRVAFPYLGLPAGLYRVAGGFRAEGRWLGYRGNLLRLAVAEDSPEDHQGLFALHAEIHTEENLQNVR